MQLAEQLDHMARSRRALVTCGTPTPPIDDFRGKLRWLSNFGASSIEFAGHKWATVEHAYQAAKTFDPEEQRKIREAKTPGQAKRLGRRVTLRPDWEDVKLSVMYNLTKLKYRIPELRQKLLDTGHAELIEGNTWGDTFWGVCNGVGENNLGKILMLVRHEIREEEMKGFARGTV